MKGLAHVGAVLLVWSGVTGCSASDELAGPCSPAASRQFSADWNQLSDAQLYGEVVAACGRVFVGFKEASATRGVDQYGHNLTSAETISRTKRYLIDRGFTFEWESSDLPHASARMPLSRELVSEMRRHSNIDYLEPIFPGIYLGRE